MPITFVSTGSVATAASGDLTVTPPTTQAGDIMVCAGSARDGAGAIVAFPADWLAVTLGNGSNLTGFLGIKRATGVEGSFVISHQAPNNNQIVARVALYRGVGSGVGFGIIDRSGVNTIQLMQLNSASALCTVPADIPDLNCMLIFTNHVQANTTGFSNFFIRNSKGNPRLMERFLQNGDSSGSGANKTIVSLSDVNLRFPVTGLLSAVISSSQVNIAGVVALVPQGAIIMNNAKIGMSPSKVVLGTI